MNRSGAIRIFCVECSGGSAQEVTLCQIDDCPLWQYRLGCGMKSSVYIERVRGAWGRGGEAAKEARAAGKTLDSYLKNTTFKQYSRKKSRPTVPPVGVGPLFKTKEP
jgi:hypothetical protein